MGLLTDTNFSGAAGQRPGGGGMQQPSMQSMLAQRLMQNAMQRRQSNPLSQTLSAPPPGLDMMPGLAGGPPRQPVGALPGGGGAMGAPGAASIAPMGGMQQGAISSLPKSFAGMGMGDTAPQVSTPSDSGPLSQMSGGASSKMGDSFSAPSATPAGAPVSNFSNYINSMHANNIPEPGFEGPSAIPQINGINNQNPGMSPSARMQLIMQYLNSQGGQ
jgi:hypothetical protein